MGRWIDEPWAKDPAFVMDRLEVLYTKAIRDGKCTTPVDTTVKKIMELRGWCNSVDMGNLRSAVEEMEVVYLPAAIAPGPGILFPIRDVTGEIKRLHIRLVDEKKYGAKYLSIVDKAQFIGPAWLGDSDEKLAGIIRSREVVVVEGPMDLLALRTLNPDLPDLCPLTKRFADKHWDYLRILGVQRVYALFDNEVNQQGETGVQTLSKFAKGIAVEGIKCSGKDPADVMKNPAQMRVLRETLLRRSNPTIPTSALSDYE